MRTLIYGGRIIDPANKIDSKLNLLIEDGKILRIGTEDMDADTRINAEGKVVCPGFIDVHVHEDPVDATGHIYSDEDASVFSCMLRMGVTTVVGGNCGCNVYDPADYLDLVDRDGAPVNVAMQAGHEFFRFLSGAGDRYGKATEEQIDFIAAELEKRLERGCVGISYGIRYTPGMDRHELMKTAASCKSSNKPVSCHVRSDAAEIYDSLEEFMDVMQELKLPAQVSHIGSMAGFGQMEKFLSMIDAYKLGGADLMCDCYPYSAFSTGLGSATYDEGWLERYHCDYSVVEMCEGKYKGQRCTKESFEEIRRDLPGCVTVCYVMKPEEIELALRHPSVMLCSDATMNRGHGHPRAAGAFPRLISEYVRGGKMSLYDAVSKMTALPAQRYGLANKGRLNVGADADVVVFDPERIRDRSTFSEPILPPEGIDYVFVNGELAAKDCRIVDQRRGRSVRT